MTKVFAHAEQFPSCCGASILRSFIPADDGGGRLQVNKSLVKKNE